ncbi:hypothetical protein KAM338_34090 [Aeromonas caviae]|uniref:hypothetical protein n=1 Tax=Aeromonas TaxID=642 RepID=UPI00185FC844|nr:MULTISPECIES: hypothetical protein [Aeromonas]MDU7578959.1 hypothetical protein [Aeromonas sp.]BCK63417.1 hypothetical protein KAM330_24060 [Aeromonas hydrophila]GKQ63232.1 hypothetical protein KAM338_34090 [Aeromonas caviae]
MQLDEFVKATIMQVVKGVKDAQEEAAEYGAVVNPRGLEGQGMRKETSIAFDVALTVTGTNSEEIGGKLTVASILNLGGKVTESDARQETSRVQFDVSVSLPSEGRKKTGVSKAAVAKSRSYSI